MSGSGSAIVGSRIIMISSACNKCNRWESPIKSNYLMQAAHSAPWTYNKVSDNFHYKYWGNCQGCKSMHVRKVAALAVLLYKLGVRVRD